MEALIRMLSERYRLIGKGINYAFWLVISLVFLFTSGTRAYTNLKDGRKINGPFDSFSSEMFNYIRTETSPESVIIFFKPRAMHLFTDHDSIMVLQCDHLTRGDFVALHKTWEYSQILPGEIRNCNVSLKATFENRRFVVYRILK